MNFKDNCVFKLYDLKKNSKFFSKDTFELPEDIYFKEDDKSVYVYGMEEGITELLELLYDKAFKYDRTSRNEYLNIEIEIYFTDNVYEFENAIDALEAFRNKNISDVESVIVFSNSHESYTFVKFLIIHDKGIVKKIVFDGRFE